MDTIHLHARPKVEPCTLRLRLPKAKVTARAKEVARVNEDKVPGAKAKAKSQPLMTSGHSLLAQEGLGTHWAAANSIETANLTVFSSYLHPSQSCVALPESIPRSKFRLAPSPVDGATPSFQDVHERELVIWLLGSLRPSRPGAVLSRISASKHDGSAYMICKAYYRQ